MNDATKDQIAAIMLTQGSAGQVAEAVAHFRGVEPFDEWEIEFLSDKVTDTLILYAEHGAKGNLNVPEILRFEKIKRLAAKLKALKC